MDDKLMSITVGVLIFPYIQLLILKDMVVNNEEWRKVFEG